MEQNVWDKILFFDSLVVYPFNRYTDHVLHILCTDGNVSFSFQNVHYNIVPGDYVILTNPLLATNFSESDDFEAVIMSLSDSFVTSMAIRSNYGIIGHLSLLQNPVMKLSPHDYRICMEDLLRIRERLIEESHLFREELMGYLLIAHIIDLYDIHARNQEELYISERNADLLRRFIGLLNNKVYVQNRNLGYYASLLCITPHYLTEVCKKVSGEPATYWIDRFTIHEITRLLHQKEIPLKDIAERMNFSSLSHFSRYVQKQIGIPPSEYKNRVNIRPLL